MTPKEVKRKIRELKRLKRGIKVGCQARRDINKKIRELKEQINYDVSPEKEKLIKEIEGIRKHCVDLRKFTVEQLQIHLNKLKRK